MAVCGVYSEPGMALWVGLSAGDVDDAVLDAADDQGGRGQPAQVGGAGAGVEDGGELVLGALG
ncbi:hypothetical protein AOZ06_04215 [Kibdelosporangium phytohabitans]|uniref:Uncharacterized protein n=2 Tax=Kibdelosporangium phytohabitans TaxID=860235 RepID=A0A0N9HNZ3_9PSEU|nr:hypothetical protein AOZ06_04215 [Kibdelosporangium phytohabitans]